jgi:hypothetical protein
VVRTGRATSVRGTLLTGVDGPSSTSEFDAAAFVPDRFPAPDADFEIQSAIEW